MEGQQDKGHEKFLEKEAVLDKLVEIEHDLQDKKHAIQEEADRNKHVIYKDHAAKPVAHDIDVPVYDEKKMETHMEHIKAKDVTHTTKDLDLPVWDSEKNQGHIEHVHYDK